MSDDHAVADHYWIDCDYCDEPTVAFERYCRHCDADRASHREVDW